MLVTVSHVCTQQLLNCAWLYMSDSGIDMKLYGCCERTGLMLGLWTVWLHLCVEAKNGSSISECSKVTELWCDDCSDLSAQHGLHKDWTWSRWWSVLTILRWNPAGCCQARRATSVDKFPTSWRWRWCELSMFLLLTACSSCQCVCC